MEQTVGRRDHFDLVPSFSDRGQQFSDENPGWVVLVGRVGRGEHQYFEFILSDLLQRRILPVLRQPEFRVSDPLIRSGRSQPQVSSPAAPLIGTTRNSWSQHRRIFMPRNALSLDS